MPGARIPDAAAGKEAEGEADPHPAEPGLGVGVATPTAAAGLSKAGILAGAVTSSSRQAYVASMLMRSVPQRLQFSAASAFSARQ